MNKLLKLQMIFGATDKASSSMKGIQASGAKMGAELKKSRDELSRLNQTQKNVDGFRSMKRELGDTGRALDAAQNKTREMAAAINSTDNPTKEMQRNFNRAKKEAAALGTEFDQQQRGVEDLRRELKSAGIGTTDLGADQRKLKRDMEAASGAVRKQEDALAELDRRQGAIDAGRSRMERTQQTGDKLMGGGAKAIAAGAAIGVPIIYATKEAGDFQAQLVDVRKVLDSITPAGMKKLENGLLEMSGRIPVPVEGLGQIAAEAARAGIAAKDLLPFTENAAKMAAAFDMTADESGAMMANWRKGLDLTIPQTIELGDKVNALTNAFGGTASKVADMVTRVGPLGKVAGVASGEMAAMAQLMNALGIEREIGSTGIKNFMLTLSAGESATKKQAAAMEHLGLNSVEMAKMMQTDARGAILSVLDAIAQLPKEQQAGMLTNMFGRESVAAIAPMLSSLDQLKKNFALVGDAQQYAGSMNREFDVAMSKTNNKVDLAKNGLSGMAISFGTHLLPLVDAGAEKIAKVANAIGSWARENPGLARGIGVVMGILAALLVGAGSLALAIGALLGPFAALRFALMFAGPVLKSSMAIKVLGAAFGILKTVIMAVGRAMLANPILAIIAAIALAAYLIYDNWGTIGPWFQKLWENVTQFFSAAWEGIKNLFLNYTPQGLIIKHWSAIIGFFAGLWTRVRNIFSEKWASIKSMMSGWFGSMSTIGRQIINGLIAGIKAAPGAVWKALSGIVTGAISKAKNLLGIKSPSRLFMSMGRDTMRGMELGLESGGKRAIAKMASVTKGLARAGAGLALAGGISGGLTAQDGGATANSIQSDIGLGAIVGRRPPPPPAGANAYSFHFHIKGSKDSRQTADDVAKAVEDAIRKIEREKAAERRSEYRDDD